MKVVAKEHALGATGIVASNGGCGGKNLIAIGWQCNHRFDGLHQCGHAQHVFVGQKNGACCKQERAALPDQFEQARFSDLRLECLAQRRGVQADAEALAVEDLDIGPHVLAIP